MHEHNKQVVRRWVETVRGGETDIWSGILQHWHEDATWTLIGHSTRSGTFRGLKSIKEDFMDPGRRGDGRPGHSVQGLSSEYGVHFTCDEIIALEDGRVAVFGKTDARGRNGVPYNNEYAWIFTVRGDRIAALYEYCDTLAIEEAHFDKKLVPRGTTVAAFKT
jgi:ketosteroid isomerase-like protein